MKKLLVGCFLLVIVSVSVFAQNSGGKQTIDDVWAVLEGNFTKYPYVHLLNEAKTEDKRPPALTIVRSPYDKGVDEFDRLVTGEIIRIMVREAGYRYEIALDFVGNKRSPGEGSAMLSPTVRARLYNGILKALKPPTTVIITKNPAIDDMAR